MKKITCILFLCLLSVNTSIYSQNKATLEDLLERLTENHMGSITDVFSLEEIDELNLHFSKQRGEVDFQSNRSLTGEVFAPENVNNNFGKFGLITPGTFNIIGPSLSADFEGAGAYDPFTGLFYVIDNLGNSYAVNPISGVYLGLGTVTAPPGESFTGLEFDQSTGTLYAISTDGAGSSTLSTIDTTTGVVTVIGNTALVLAIALSMDILGAFLYSYDIDTDIMYRINKLNAQTTPIGPIGFDASFGQGMFVDIITGLIYMTAFNNGAFRSELRTVNTDTGMSSLVGPIGSDAPGGTVQLAWASQNKTVLGVSENSLASLQIYPNPVNSILELNANSTINSIEIYNILGQKVMQQSIEALSSTVDIQHLKTGYYILNVTVNGNKGSFKLLKQ